MEKVTLNDGTVGTIAQRSKNGKRILFVPDDKQPKTSTYMMDYFGKTTGENLEPYQKQRWLNADVVKQTKTESKTETK